MREFDDNQLNLMFFNNLLALAGRTDGQMTMHPVEKPMAADQPARENGVNDSRRDVLAAALGLLGFLGASRDAEAEEKATAAAKAAEPSAADGAGGHGGEAEFAPSVDPAKNVSWEGWDKPSADDGWDNWETLLNPNGLPIFYDRFAGIPYREPSETGARAAPAADSASPFKHHWVMVMDVDKCVGCQACTVACKVENNVALGVYRTWVDVYQTGDTVPDLQGDIVVDGQRYRQDVKVVSVPKICNHCADPPCVMVCPVKATYKRADGLVLVDHTLCIGCGTCVNACPYNARYIDPISRTADKCTFCVERIDAGLLPACVTTCTGRARVFGDLNDPSSEVSRLLAENPYTRRHVEYGTDPQVYYIGKLAAEIEHDPDPASRHMVFPYTANANNAVVKTAPDVV